MVLDLDVRRLVMERTTDLILCGWGAVNVLVSAVVLLRKPADRARGFWWMNAGFGVVNLGLGLSVLLPVLAATPGMSALEIFRRMDRLTRLFALSCGLDVAYAATGFALWERGLRKVRSLLVGMGQSLLIQGSALLAFDVVLLMLHDRLGVEALQTVLGGR